MRVCVYMCVCVCVREGREVVYSAQVRVAVGYRLSLITADGSLVCLSACERKCHLFIALTGAIISVL